MKKILFAIVLLFATNIAFAQEPKKRGDNVILHPTSQGQGQGEERPRRSPVAIPKAYIDGNTLSFSTSCIGCPVTLLDEDENIVYTAIVGNDGTVTLPENLTGVFELQLQRGSITFVGTIIL